MSFVGQQLGLWEGQWLGGTETDPNRMYGTAQGTSVVTGRLIDVSTPVVAGGVPGRGRPRIHRPIAVVEYDGRDYRVPLDNLDDFLELVKKKAEKPEPVKVVKNKKKKTLKVSHQPPKLVIKSAPPEFLMEFRQFVDKSNEILQKIWQGMISRSLAEMDDEEALLLLL